MIAANELRMGNWVKSNNPHDGRFVKFKYFHEDLHVAFFYKEAIGAFTKDIVGIPLTPEILEKCGLKNGNSELDRNVFYSTNKHLAQFSVNISGSFGIYVGVFIALRSVHLEYLHQLQNLYFALTNSELTINL